MQLLGIAIRSGMAKSFFSEKEIISYATISKYTEIPRHAIGDVDPNLRDRNTLAARDKLT